MSVLDNIVTVSDLQRRTSQFIKRARKEPIIITQRGRPTALLVNAERYMAMVERLRELEDRELSRMIEQAKAEFEAGEGVPHEEAVVQIRAAWTEKNS